MASLTKWIVWAIVPVCSFGHAFAADPNGEQSPTAQHIDQLIMQLGADRFDAREKATEELIKLGDASEEKLQSALSAKPSVELKRRGKDILAKIKQNRITRNAISTEDFFEPIKFANQDRFDQAAYEAKLHRLAAILAEVTGNEPLKLPSNMRSSTMQDGRRTGAASHAVVMGEKVAINLAHDSLILGDLAVDVVSAHRCVIVARYSVRVTSCSDSIVIVGQSIAATSIQGGAVLCGGRSSFTSADKSILCIRQFSPVSGRGNDLINCGSVDAQRNPPRFNEPQTRRFEAGGIMVAPATSPGTLARQITLTFAESPTRTQDGGLVVFKCAGAPGEYVTRLENGLKSPDGKTLPGVDGWKLRYSGGTFAVFSNGEHESCLEVDRPDANNRKE